MGAILGASPGGTSSGDRNVSECMANSQPRKVGTQRESTCRKMLPAAAAAESAAAADASGGSQNPGLVGDKNLTASGQVFTLRMRKNRPSFTVRV